MTHLSRRGFIAGGAATGLALAGPFRGFVASAGAPLTSALGGGYGPLGPVPDLRDGVVRLELPAGFQYRSFHVANSMLTDGVTPLRGRHDGMAAFRGPGGATVLVRNHEINNPGPTLGGGAPLYDPHTQGGTVTVVVDGQGNVLDDWVSLQGTQMNCAGGRTPWGSWISCEETVNGDDVGSDFTGAPNTGLLAHGYVFEVPADGVGDPVPIRAAGRFAHEAAAVAHDWRRVYLTEDNFGFPSGFYRYTPPRSPRAAGRLEDGGRLEMLAVKGIDNAPLHLDQAPGATYRVGWVTIDDPDPTFAPGTTNDQAIVAVGDQGRAKGAAIFSRLEGAYTGPDGTIYFVSTQGGATADAAPSGFGDGRGQVWAYEPQGQRLRLVYQSPAAATLDLPDNVVVRNSTGSLLLCEDGSGDNYLRGLTADGQLFDFARNADLAQVGQEFAGATFSPDGETLYVNIQSGSGYSIAIWGPWSNGPM